MSDFSLDALDPSRSYSVLFNGAQVPVEIEPEAKGTVSPQQREALRQLLSLTPDVLAASAPAVVQNYEVYREAIGDEELPPLPEPADLWFESPLAFTALMHWGRLAGAPRKFFDSLFAQGTAKFPDYMPLYNTQAYNLFPRWFGEAGEAEALLKKRADKIGGADGDIFYGLMVWDLASSTGQLSLDTQFDYVRAHRGLKLLHERFPDSVAVVSARLGLAFIQVDPKIMQPILREGKGYVINNTGEPWSLPLNRNRFTDYRMYALGEQPVP